MIPEDCLFYEDGAQCSEVEKPEHIVQASLGGTLADRRIICEACNGHFGGSVDPALARFYSPIIRLLSSMMGGRLKKKIEFGKSVDAHLPLRFGSGGMTDLRNIVVRRDAAGIVTELLGPHGTSNEQLAAIAANVVGPGVKLNFCEVPLTEVAKESSRMMQLDLSLVRAVALDLLELTRYASVKHGTADLARHERLSELRRSIRHGDACREIQYSTIPFAPISDLIAPLFSPCMFSNRLVVSYDAEQSVLVLAAQFLNTMPWVFVVERGPLHNQSLSILYQKALVDGEDMFDTCGSAVLDAKTIKQWRLFSSRTGGAIAFAQGKLVQGYRTQLGCRTSITFTHRRQLHRPSCC